MAKMFITIKIMPESPEVDLNSIRTEAKKFGIEFSAELLDKDVIEPVAFGLNALKIIFLIDESKGSEDLTDKIASIEGVSSAEAVDMRRAIG